jgi:hypothetical protein
MTQQSKRVLPATAILLAATRNDNFKDDATAFLDWAQESFKFERKYVSHTLKVGQMLIRSKPEVFGRLTRLPMDKLLAVSRLAPDVVESYITSKDLEAAGRDEVRADVSRLLGEEAKEKKAPPKIDAPAYGLREMIAEASGMSDEAIAIMGEDSTPEQMRQMIGAGQSLIISGLRALTDKKLDSAEDVRLIADFAAGLAQFAEARQAQHKTQTAVAQIAEECAQVAEVVK